MGQAWLDPRRIRAEPCVVHLSRSRSALVALHRPGQPLAAGGLDRPLGLGPCRRSRPWTWTCASGGLRLGAASVFGAAFGLRLDGCCRLRPRARPWPPLSRSRSPASGPWRLRGSGLGRSRMLAFDVDRGRLVRVAATPSIAGFEVALAGSAAGRWPSWTLGPLGGLGVDSGGASATSRFGCGDSASSSALGARVPARPLGRRTIPSGRSGRPVARPCRRDRAGRRPRTGAPTGHGGIERADRAPQRDPHEQVAALADGRPETLALAARRRGDRPAQVGLASGQRRVAIGAGHPDTVAVEVHQGRRQVVHRDRAADAPRRRPRP